MKRVRPENSNGIRSWWSPIKEEFQDYLDPVAWLRGEHMKRYSISLVSRTYLVTAKLFWPTPKYSCKKRTMELCKNLEIQVISLFVFIFMRERERISLKNILYYNVRLF